MKNENCAHEEKESFLFNANSRLNIQGSQRIETKKMIF